MLARTVGWIKSRVGFDLRCIVLVHMLLQWCHMSSSCDITVITCALKQCVAVITQSMFPKIFIQTTYIPPLWLYQPGSWFNIKMLYYQYRKSHSGDKTIPSYLHNEISYTGMTTSLYWIGAQTLLYIIPCWIRLCYNQSTVSPVWNYWLEWLVFVQRCRLVLFFS